MDEIPGLRDEFLGFLAANAFVAPTAGGERPLNELEAAKLGARAGIDTPIEGVFNVNVSGFGPITHDFARIDQATPADAAAIVSKLREAGYNGPLPVALSQGSPAGRIMVQQANSILEAQQKGIPPGEILTALGLS